MALENNFKFFCVALQTTKVCKTLCKNLGWGKFSTDNQHERFYKKCKWGIKEIQIPVQGGLDPKILLTDKDNLKKNTLKYLEIFKDHPYIFNLGHGVLPETDPNMVDYLVKMVKDY